MKTSAINISLTEAGQQSGFVPAVRPDATMEELDEWVLAIGGHELTEAESKALRDEVRWHDVPGEADYLSLP